MGEAWAINETTDAYDQSALSFAAGLERRFRKDWRNWWASARVSVEAGSLKDNYRGRRTYSLLGFPLSVRRDTTNSLLNPTTGTRVTLEVTPYTGTFNGPLTTVRTRLDASGYWSPGWDRRTRRRGKPHWRKCPEYSGLVAFLQRWGRLGARLQVPVARPA